MFVGSDVNDKHMVFGTTLYDWWSYMLGAPRLPLESSVDAASKHMHILGTNLAHRPDGVPQTCRTACILGVYALVALLSMYVNTLHGVVLPYWLLAGFARSG